MTQKTKTKIKTKVILAAGSPARDGDARAPRARVKKTINPLLINLLQI